MRTSSDIQRVSKIRKQQKIEIVCMVRVNGEKVPQESIPREEFNKMLEKKIDETMQNLCFERIRTA